MKKRNGVVERMFPVGNESFTPSWRRTLNRKISAALPVAVLVVVLLVPQRFGVDAGPRLNTLLAGKAHCRQ
jgi:hypothetical protein